MKNINTIKLLAVSLMLCLGGAAFAQTQADDDALRRALLKKNPPAVLKIVFEEESPNDYQKDQILNTVTKLADAARGQKFAGYPQMAFFMNGLLGQEHKDSALLKDAFPERDKAKPKGGLDCDSRSILILAAIDMLGYPLGRNIYMADTIITSQNSEQSDMFNELFGTNFAPQQQRDGHVVLYDGKDFFDMTNNQIVTLAEDERLISNVLNTPDKIRSMLMASAAADAAMGARGNAITGKKEDKKGLSGAIDRLKKAVELNPKNFVALENLYTLTKDTDYKIQIAGLMIANYLDIYSLKTVDFKNLTAEVRTQQKPAAQNPNMEAIKNSAPIYNYISGLQADVFYAEKFEESIKIGNILLAAKPDDKTAFINAYLARAYFRLKDYDKAMEHTYKAVEIRNAPDYPSEMKGDFNSTHGELREYKSVIDIIKGNVIITDDNIAELAKVSPIVRQLMTGETISMSYMQPAEALRGWEGCREMAARLSPAVAPGASKFCNNK